MAVHHLLSRLSGPGEECIGQEVVVDYGHFSFAY